MAGAYDLHHTRRNRTARVEIIPNPTKVATWLNYYEATDIDGTKADIGAESATAAPWAVSQYSTAGSTWNIAADSASNASRYLDTTALAIGPATHVASGNGTKGSATATLVDADLATIRAIAQNSIFWYGRLFTLDDDLVCGASSRFGNRYLCMGWRSGGELYVELNTPTGSDTGEIQFWKSTATPMTTGYHSLVVSQYLAADGGVVAYLDGVPYTLAFDEGDATAPDEDFWIADIDQSSGSPHSYGVGARVDGDDPHVITFGADAYTVAHGMTVNGSLVSATGAKKLHTYITYRYPAP